MTNVIAATTTTTNSALMVANLVVVIQGVHSEMCHPVTLKTVSVGARRTLKANVVMNVNLASSILTSPTDLVVHLASVMVTRQSVKVPLVTLLYRWLPNSTNTKNTGQQLISTTDQQTSNTTNTVKVLEQQLKAMNSFISWLPNGSLVIKELHTIAC